MNSLNAMPIGPTLGKVMYLAPPLSGGARNTVSDLLRLMGSDDVDSQHAASVPVPMRRLRAGETLFHEGGRAESIYFVRSGTFKIFHTAADGYEQVLGFVGRTEVLGFDAVSTNGHPTEAVALEDSSVYVLPMCDLFALAERCRALGRVVHLSVSDALARQCELADVMAAVAAEVRLARFLVHLSHRMAACGQSPRRFVLRMSRRDIASYLGVAHETVSRSFTALAGWHLVEVDNREVEIVDMEGLRALSLGTRRQIDEASRRSAAHPAAAVA
jgi:CRP/FNR family transcriptional regulator